MPRRSMGLFKASFDANKICNDYADHIERLVEHKRCANIEVED